VIVRLTFVEGANIGETFPRGVGHIKHCEPLS